MDTSSAARICASYQRLPIRDGLAPCAAGLRIVAAGHAVAYAAYPFGGGGQIVLQNARVRVVFAPQSGGRAFVFEDLATGRSAFTTVGALRDDVAVQPPPSTTDRIGKYTNTFPAGTFNRPYRVTILESGKRAVVRLTYFAPDAFPNGATFDRTVILTPDATSFSVDESATYLGSTLAVPQQTGISLTSLSVGNPRSMTTQSLLGPDPEPFKANSVFVPAANAFGFYDRATHELATVAWRPGDVRHASVAERTDSVVLRLEFVADRASHVEYGYVTAPTVALAQSLVQASASTLQGRTSP